METLNDFASQMEAATKEGCSALSQATDDMAHFYNTHAKKCQEWVFQTLHHLSIVLLSLVRNSVLFESTALTTPLPPAPTDIQ